MNAGKKQLAVFLLLLAAYATSGSPAWPPSPGDSLVKLDNPVTAQYLKRNLRKSHPRLILTAAREQALKKKIKSDPVVKNMYQALKLNAGRIMKEPLLKRDMIGRRLLSTSREMLYRMNVLGMVYVLDRDPATLKRIDEEVNAVCRFADWNPSHYLDVAEMAMAIAFAIDWVGKDLPSSTVTTATTALIEKGIKPSFGGKQEPGWVKGHNNWNQVCNGGMIAAALTIAERDPELAARTISRALDGMPHALMAYAPDGIYPEGSTYWSYGTGFTALTSSMLKSALGTDFGIAAYPALMKSADFKLLSVAPSGWYYNFADCGDKRGQDGDVELAWFATETGNSAYFEKDRFLRDPASMGKLSRHAGAGLVWLSQFEPKKQEAPPLFWKGDGINPVVFFRGGESDPRGFYLGAKGGRGTVSHGNLDAGSFILELDGVRWSIDPGNQEYNALEITGFNLWGNCQTCERWTLLTKNNFGHSTLTVNDERHLANGFAPIIAVNDEDKPSASIDLTPVFNGKLKTAVRTFTRENDYSVVIEDQLEVNDSTRMITWQMMTTADVRFTTDGAVLEQDGKRLTLTILSPQEVSFSTVALDPAPLKLDRQIEDLKRLEIRVPAYVLKEGSGSITVRLSGD